MVPATGPGPETDSARAALAEIACPAPDRFDDPALLGRASDPGVRAGLAALAGTIAEPLLDAFVDGQAAVRELGVGPTASPGRVIGPHADDPDRRVLNERYRAEHPALLALSLTHDLLWRGDEPNQGPNQVPNQIPNQIEEAMLHALGAMVHLQLVARVPRIAHLGTELARRQNSLALTLLDSRNPGEAAIAVVAPSGPGTIPGGHPTMQTPDFWSIPFVGSAPPSQAPDAPVLLGACLALVATPGAALPDPLRYDTGLGPWFSEHLGRRWLSVQAQLRAAVALGLVDEHDLAAASGLDAARAIDAFGVDEAVACFRSRS